MRTDEFEKYGNYLSAEKNELKRQFKEIESRF